MTISRSLSDEAINEFASRISSDQEISPGLRKQLTTLIGEEKWKREASVSDALEAFYSTLEGGLGDKA
jgi:predicted outer membrane protein